MKTRIIGTGSYLPKQIVTNDYLATIVETNDEWIQSRTGIKQRHLVKEETCSELATMAAKNAIQNANMAAEDIELIIVATCSGDAHFPNTACVVQKEIGATKAVAFDLSAACSGFLFALNTANAYLTCGMYDNALIIGAEVLSKLTDWTDRGTCILFGDGAGACVVKRDDKGIRGMVQGADGSKADALLAYDRPIYNPFNKEEKPLDHISMEGQEVFKFAVSTVPKCITQVLEETNTDIEDITYFVLHQANMRILASVAKRLKVDIEKFPMNLDRCGNTSAASIPILLDELNQEGKLKRGDKLILSGFGAGLTWGAILLEW